MCIRTRLNSAIDMRKLINAQGRAQFVKQPRLRQQTSSALKEGKEQVRVAAQSAKRIGPIQRLLEAQSQLLGAGVSIKELLSKSLIASLTFGTAFQVTHNNGLLPVRQPSQSELHRSRCLLRKFRVIVKLHIVALSCRFTTYGDSKLVRSWSRDWFLSSWHPYGYYMAMHFLCSTKHLPTTRLPKKSTSERSCLLWQQHGWWALLSSSWVTSCISVTRPTHRCAS